MYKRKLLAIFLMLIMTAALTAGCSQAEQGFFNLQKELSELNTYENSGDFIIKLNGLPAPSSTDPATTLFYNMLQKGITVKFTGKIDQEKESAECTLFYVNDLTKTEQVITKFICKKDIMYIKIDEIIKLAQVIGDTETSNKLKAVFGDTEYLSMTLEEYYQAAGLTEDLPRFYQNSFMNTELTKVIQKAMLGLPEAYQNYTSGVIKQNGNTYTWELTGTDAIELLVNFLEYSLNNLSDLEKWGVSVLDNLTAEEMTLFNLDSQQKSAYKALLNMGIMQLEANKEQYLPEIQKLQATLKESNEFKEIFDEFEISGSLSKNEDDVYISTNQLAMALKEDDSQFDLYMKANSQTKQIAPFTLTVPTANVMTYTEYLNKVTTTMEIQVDTHSYTLKEPQNISTGSLTVKNIENQTYLPMRQIAEIFQEKVGWDAENSQAYVLRDDDEKINMTGVIIDNRTYIKTRDFEKLGYQVDWDGQTRTVKISTSQL